MPCSRELTKGFDRIAILKSDLLNNPFYLLYAYWSRPTFTFVRDDEEPERWCLAKPDEFLRWEDREEAIFAYLNERVPSDQFTVILEPELYNNAQPVEKLRLVPDVDFTSFETIKQRVVRTLMTIKIDYNIYSLIDANMLLGIYYSELERGVKLPFQVEEYVPILKVGELTYSEHIDRNAHCYPSDDARFLETHSELACLWAALQRFDQLMFDKVENGYWRLQNRDVDPEVFVKAYEQDPVFYDKVTAVLNRIFEEDSYNNLYEIDPKAQTLSISHWFLSKQFEDEPRFCFDRTVASLYPSTAYSMDVDTKKSYFHITSRIYINLKDVYAFTFGVQSSDEMYEREDLHFEEDRTDEKDDRITEEDLLIAEMAAKLNI